MKSVLGLKKKKGTGKCSRAKKKVETLKQEAEARITVLKLQAGINDALETLRSSVQEAYEHGGFYIYG